MVVCKSEHILLSRGRRKKLTLRNFPELSIYRQLYNNFRWINSCKTDSWSKMTPTRTDCQIPYSLKTRRMNHEKFYKF